MTNRSIFYLPPKIFFAVHDIAEFCAKRNNCDACPLNRIDEDGGHDSCILRQMPEDWRDYAIYRVKSYKILSREHIEIKKLWEDEGECQ